ncbi:PLP-dependent transferase [Phototrophicus methaneseepsis]|uniref:homocysteine desulfhydrase n=1 Tax=Phototrophicus methaneseepsis TaxID=2710758 RepID=A0A7S8E622_9CHLR|nr:PLP-dependent aspartate aminotransferase family protein [Phototrophicus methaneseepsis]QPC81010.1 PLP-dependent transferase [Phototrophicus methaneseepsis]
MAIDYNSYEHYNAAEPREQGSSTRAVHAGTQRRKAFSSLTTPIVQSATFTFEDTADLCDFMDKKIWGDGLDREEYGRYGNPTIWAVEERLAALDGAEDAAIYSSGMAAVTSLLLTVLKSGQHIVMTDDCYRRTRQFCLTVLKKFGIETSVVPMGDYEALEAAIIPKKTRLIISETPTNPYLRVADLERLMEIAKASRVLTMIDTTFATPVNLRPVEWGIDFVLHSATKYLGGHNDILAGVITGRADRLKALKDSRGVFGNVIDPQAAFLLERGIKTLGIRVQQQNRSAQAVAEFLESHPKIERVWYPGLESHPDYEVARSQMTGFGGVVSFEVAGSLEDTSLFIDRCRIPYIAPSLGGVESLIEQPALVSFYELTTEERLKVGIKDNLVRFAIGVEDTDDIIADLDQALAGIPDRRLEVAWEARFRL